MTDIHPLFADRPALDPIAWEMMRILHSQVPEDKAPKGWSDYSEAQVLRAKHAALSVLTPSDDRVKRAREAFRDEYNAWVIVKGPAYTTVHDGKRDKLMDPPREYFECFRVSDEAAAKDHVFARAWRAALTTL